MKACRTIAITMIALCGSFALAEAAPPTVTPSPGYDARLQESRQPRISGPATTTAPAVAPKHAKKKHAK